MFAQTTLADWLRRQPRPLPIPLAVELVRQAAADIQALHDRQSIHQNINLTHFVVQEIDTNHPTLRLVPSNDMPSYIAPEQGMGYSTFATDQYALAVMAYELLTGRPPFPGSSIQLHDLQTRPQPPLPSTIRPEITPALDTVLMNALAKHPEERFPSTLAFSNALFQAIRVPGSMVTSVPATAVTGPLRTRLYISNSEAVSGTLRTLALPQGQRVVIPIPKGAYDGQIIPMNQYDTVRGVHMLVELTVVVTATDTNPPQVTFVPPPLPIPPPSLPIPPAPRPAQSNSFWSRRRITLIALLAGLLLVIILGGVGAYLLLLPKVAMPYPPNSGTLALNDLLHDNSKGYNWPNASNGGGICTFSQNAYHVHVDKQSTLHYCLAGNTSYSNFAYEAQMTILKGDGGGLIFRADGNTNKFYYFRVTQDGFYGLYLYSDTHAAHTKTLTIGRAAAIRIGTTIPNVLAIVAHDANISLYVNNQSITSISDTTYTSGQIGVAATYDTLTTEVTFNNAKVWTF